MTKEIIDLSRRDFIKKATAGVAVVGTVGVIGTEAVAKETQAMTKKNIKTKGKVARDDEVTRSYDRYLESGDVGHVQRALEKRIAELSNPREL